MSSILRRFVEEKIKPIMKDVKKIRNCTIIAHIDHGKTTLSDNLIAHSGIIAKKLASELRYLDYEEIEQKRGITIKPAYISINHEFNGENYVINLIDTPGHIDFSGHVIRSLRVSDGAIVVVDAVEGVMVQTETVTRQALIEYVKPILFINKVDRLIKEKKLDKRSLLSYVDNIVRDFNLLIERYGDDMERSDWKVSFKKGNLVLGSAKDKWGVNVYSLVKKGDGVDGVDRKEMLVALLKFLDYVYDCYDSKRLEELAENFPLAESVLDSVIIHLPDPSSAQSYRMRKIWGGNVESDIGRAISKCDQNSPAVIFVSHLLFDKRSGRIAIGRIFSGKVKVKDELYLVNGRAKEAINSMAIFMGHSKVNVREATAGNIVAFIGLKKVKIGETMVSPEVSEFTPIEEFHYVSDPIVTYRVEPVRLSDLEAVKDFLSNYVDTDPNLRFTVDEDTGELLLSGMGELHIEVTLQKLREVGIYLEAGRPIVVYKEGIGKESPFLKRSEDGLEIGVKLYPVSECEARSFEEGVEIPRLREVLKKCKGIDFDDVILVDRRNMNVVISSGVPQEFPIRDLKTALKMDLKKGPLMGGQCSKIIAYLDVKCVGDPRRIDLLTIEICLNAMKDAFLQSDPVLLEPWQRLQITVPEKYLGKVLDIA
ncbi:MAG: GTP-binding protein, partial [Candidatus Asgardarchaeia archaeon]